ncbi:MAG: hypothetical protein COA42_22070 [Alteromonadaceae bacterium]|nr:MAG: hypothetical protein COA42_22070 [Alteromonadaceae bacterium]
MILHTQASDGSPLFALENNMRVRMFDVSAPPSGCEYGSMDGFVASIESGQQFGVLVRIEDRPNPIIKVFSLIVAWIKLHLLRMKLLRKGEAIIALYGVYPTVEYPIAIYLLGMKAEKYSNQHVLPAFPAGVNGRIRQGVMAIIKFHPSVAGVIIVAQKK